MPYVSLSPEFENRNAHTLHFKILGPCEFGRMFLAMDGCSSDGQQNAMHDGQSISGLLHQPADALCPTPILSATSSTLLQVRGFCGLTAPDIHQELAQLIDTWPLLRCTSELLSLPSAPSVSQIRCHCTRTPLRNWAQTRR
jgi:hypothetical protein